MSERRDLVVKNNKKGYVVGTLVLLALSGMGVWWLKKDQKPTIVNKIEDVTVKEIVPTESLLPSPMTEVTPIEKTTPTAKVSLIPTEIPNGILRSERDGFEVNYSPDRKLYETKESSGNRYTLYRDDSTITVHAGGKWSWIHPGREFDSNFLVASRPTFVYQTTDQKIVDFETEAKKYTIQCVFGTQSDAITECDQILRDFKLF